MIFQFSRTKRLNFSNTHDVLFDTLIRSKAMFLGFSNKSQCPCFPTTLGLNKIFKTLMLTSLMYLFVSFDIISNAFNLNVLMPPIAQKRYFHGLMAPLKKNERKSPIIVYNAYKKVWRKLWHLWRVGKKSIVVNDTRSVFMENNNNNNNNKLKKWITMGWMLTW